MVKAFFFVASYFATCKRHSKAATGPWDLTGSPRLPNARTVPNPAPDQDDDDDEKKVF